MRETEKREERTIHERQKNKNRNKKRQRRSERERHKRREQENAQEEDMRISCKINPDVATTSFRVFYLLIF